MDIEDHERDIKHTKRYVWVTLGEETRRCEMKDKDGTV
jgi:hypothetical protein